MKAVILLGLFPIFAANTAIAAPSVTSILLHCVGFDFKLQGTMERYIEIAGPTAKVSGDVYAVDTGAAYYSLKGPLNRNSNAGENLPVLITIDRVSGSYMIFDQRVLSDRASESSRPGDPGCQPVQAKF